MPQLCHSDRRNLELIVRSGSQPAAEIKSALFTTDDHISVDDYCHLSLGALSLLRAARRSFAQDLPSTGGKSNPSSASARSRPVQTLSGTKLASGAPLRSSTYCTF